MAQGPKMTFSPGSGTRKGIPIRIAEKGGGAAWTWALTSRA